MFYLVVDANTLVAEKALSYLEAVMTGDPAFGSSPRLRALAMEKFGKPGLPGAGERRRTGGGDARGQLPPGNIAGSLPPAAEEKPGGEIRPYSGQGQLGQYQGPPPNRYVSAEKITIKDFIDKCPYCGAQRIGVHSQSCAIHCVKNVEKCRCPSCGAQHWHYVSQIPAEGRRTYQPDFPKNPGLPPGGGERGGRGGQGAPPALPR